MKKKKILIVEDSPTIRRIIKNTCLKIGNIDTIETNNGLEALPKIKEHDFDLIITDWDMPQMNGLELVKIIKNTRESSSIPIVMLSTRNGVDDIRLTRDLKVDFYMIKPFDPVRLLLKIKELI